MLCYQANVPDLAAEIAVSLIDTELIPYYPDLAETILDTFNEDIISPEQWVWIIGSKGLLAHHWRRYEEAEKYYSDMLKQAGTLKAQDASAIALQRLGILMSACKEYERAEGYYLESLNIKEGLDDQEGQAQIYNELGILYCEQGRFDGSATVLKKGLAIHKQLASPESAKLWLYGSLSLLYAHNHEWTEALRFEEKVRKIAKEMNWLYELANASFNLGAFEAKQKNHDSARRYYSEALRIAKEHDLWQVEELVLNGLIHQSFELENYDEDITYAQRAIQIQEMLGDKAKLAILYFDVGIFYFCLSNHLEMAHYYEMGLDVFEYLEDKEQIDRYLHNTYQLILESIESLSLLDAIKKLKNRLLELDTSYTLAKVYQTLGMIYIEALGKKRVGFACLNKASQLFEQHGLLREHVENLLHLSRTYGLSYQYNDALATFSKAIAQAQQLDLPFLLIEAYFQRGFCFMTMESWDKAEKDYKHALELANEFEGLQIYEDLQNKLGIVYRRQGKYEEAAEILEAALSNCRTKEKVEEDVYSEIDLLSELGLVYQALAKKEEALDSFNEALALSQKYHFKKLESTSFIDLGNYYLENNQPEQAKKRFEKALEVARAANDTNLEEGSMLSLAHAHFELGTFENIQSEFEKILEHANELGHYENLIQFCTFAGQINFEERELELAAKMFEQAMMVALMIGIEETPKLESASDFGRSLNDVIKVIVEFVRIVDRAIKAHKQNDVQEFYKRFNNRLRQQDYWKIVHAFLEPIGNYLTRWPDESMMTYVSSEWKHMGSDIQST